jgi:cytochrome c biogenesis protein CcmG/thiol:disulfide interchange protein DsbE
MLDDQPADQPSIGIEAEADTRPTAPASTRSSSQSYWRVILGLVVIGVILAMVSWVESTRYATAPEFTVTTLDNRTITPALLRGKVIVLNFWATWCEPCRAEAPIFTAAASSYADRVAFIGLVSMDSPRDQIDAFIAEFQINYPNGYENGLNKAFGIDGFPMTVVINPRGQVTERFVASISAADLDDAIQRALQ